MNIYLSIAGSIEMPIAQNRPVPGRGRALPGVGAQAIEGNPLTPQEIKMFELFERESWNHERRRAHILASFATRREV